MKCIFPWIFSPHSQCPVWRPCWKSEKKARAIPSNSLSTRWVQFWNELRVILVSFQKSLINSLRMWNWWSNFFLQNVSLDTQRAVLTTLSKKVCRRSKKIFASSPKKWQTVLMFSKQRFFPSRRSSGHLESNFNRFSDRFLRRKTKKSLVFQNNQCFFSKSSPGHARCSFENLLEFFGKQTENFGSKSVIDELKFFPKKLICGHMNCSFDNCRKPFKESPKTFRTKSQDDKQTCSFFWKKFIRGT